ncbi:tryptophan-rich sensory protein [Flaviramulus sp. BrNp1-15]|uniref:TspO/MBR family protein n=1 Tax=Flaviramulus sp. BrNp1-15 TaxID=2916754 RepID=UPI001EE8B2C0|nr:TspO/MBR family protein [Flaviramulus sp. BrNp1-15]ULC58623.1 tryptophan-rich sensory protein [Flaviramulus sp. BrNp1-15]
MKLVKLVIVFLAINFAALAIGSLLMNNGPQTAWYENLNQAPWTPPGWVFGVAWTTIMVCFSIYMAYLYKVFPTNKVITLFSIQFICNVIWNYIFFNQHLIGLGLFVIILLTLIIATFLFLYTKHLKFKSIFILPYFIWLCIATSLNAYILINN